jgi:hypothetical protein
MLQGYGDTLLRAEALEKELSKARKHSPCCSPSWMEPSPSTTNEVQEMQAKSDDLIRKNNSLHQKNKGMSPLAC